MLPIHGILLKIMSVCLFMVMASLIKAAADEVPPGQAVFFRSFFALPIILGWLALKGQLRTGWRTSNPLGHFWRGLLGTSGMALRFLALGLLSLPEVTAIGYAAPLLVVIFAAMFLNEEVRAFRLTAVALGLVGVLIVLSPRLSVGFDMGTTETIGALVALMAAVVAALAHVFVRKMVATETTSAIVFWFTITSTVLSFFTIFWGWALPDWPVLLMLVGAGLFGGTGQILMTASYRAADASVVAPFEYVSMVLALGVGYFVFNEVPTVTMVLGAAIVVFAGVLIIWRERQLGLARARQRKAINASGS